MAAIRALEARSLEMMREKAEKRKLEERINMLMSQMLIGGPGESKVLVGGQVRSMEDLPAFRLALKEHQDRIREQYEGRLADLEKERESMEEEKAQVDRYKQLLLKQRDIMIALTTRLNERDEQIMALQVRAPLAAPLLRRGPLRPDAPPPPLPAGRAGRVRQAPERAGGEAG